MASTISPNMLLVIPTVGSQPGPTYATNVNNSLTLIDQHDHTTGKGVPITPAGLNINADLAMNGYNLSNSRSLTLQVQSAALPISELNRLYDVNGDLYFNDGLGNQIAITASGAVAGTPGSIANLVPPASASYVSVSSTFVWQSNTNTAANLDAASLKMRNLTVSSFALTLSPPTLSSNYTITLPSLPASQKIMTLDNSGNMSAPYDVDNVGLEISSNTIQLKDQGVTAVKLAPKPNVGSSSATPGNVTVSASCGTFTTTSTSFVDVTNLLVAQTSASGRPVKIALISDASGTAAYLQSTGAAIAELRVVDTSGNEYSRVLQAGASSIVNPLYHETFDFGLSATASRSYKVQIRVPGGGSITLQNYKLVAYEI